MTFDCYLEKIEEQNNFKNNLYAKYDAWHVLIISMAIFYDEVFFYSVIQKVLFCFVEICNILYM